MDHQNAGSHHYKQTKEEVFSYGYCVRSAQINQVNSSFNIGYMIQGISGDHKMHLTCP